MPTMDQTNDGTSQKLSHAWVITPLVVATLVALYPALSGGFINWGLDAWILQDAANASWSGLFTSAVQEIYAPLTLATFKLEHALYGGDAMGYHWGNLLLHMINVLLVYFLINRLSKNVAVAAITALLFSIHPLQVEAVSWISARSFLLAATLALGSMLLYARHAQQSSVWRLVVSMILFGMALLAGAAALLVPVALVGIDLACGRKQSLRTWLEKLPFVAFAILSGITALQAISTDPMPEIVSTRDGVFLAGHAMLGYVIKVVAPFNLSAVYALPEETGLFGLIGFVVLLGALVFAWVKRTTGAMLWGVVLMVAAWLPFMGYALLHPHPHFFMADRFAYLGLVGAFYLLAWLLEKAITANQQWLKTSGVAVLAMFVITCGILSWYRTQVWANSRTLWEDVIEHQSRSALAFSKRSELFTADRQWEAANVDLSVALDLDSLDMHFYEQKITLLEHDEKWKAAIDVYDKLLAFAPNNIDYYMGRGLIYKHLTSYELALDDFNKVYALDKDNVSALSERGLIFYIQGDYQSALDEFDKALEIDRGAFEIYNNRAMVHKLRGSYDLALEDYKVALQINPNSFEALRNRGNIHKEQLRDKEAIADYTRAIALDSTNFEVYNNRGNAYINIGQFDKAIPDLDRAVQLCNDCAIAYFNRGIAHGRSGKYKRALDDFAVHEKLKPNDMNMLANRGNVYLSMGKYEEALQDYERVLQQQPQNAMVHYNMGVVYTNQKKWRQAIQKYTDAAEANYSYAEAYNNRSLANREIGNYKAALKDAQFAKHLGFKVLDSYIAELEALANK